MNSQTPSPKILDVVWGRIEIDGHGQFKDVKLYPGGARAWDWRETGTGHQPGIQFSDVEELLAHGAQVVVLSQGMNQALHVAPETLPALAGRGITVHVLPTNEAVQRYNELAEDQLVGGLFHTTC